MNEEGVNWAALANYVASVAFAITAAVLIGTPAAAFACMLAWLSCYVGMWAAALEGDQPMLLTIVSWGLTAISALAMLYAFLLRVA